MFQSFVSRLLSFELALCLMNISSFRKTLDCVDECVTNELVECLSVLQIYGKLSTIPNLRVENFGKKSFFFEKRTRLGRFGVVVLCVLQLEVVCACRPSSRLCLEESSVLSMYFSMFKSSVCVVFCIDFSPYL